MLKFKLHPLFIVFGIYFAFTGKVFSFIIYTLSATLHELGHYSASEKLGYKLNKIVLMPYGAIISGNVTDLRYKDECKVALAGPLVNFLVAVFFTAIWWVFPFTYAFTEEIVIANFSLAVINLLPCYPLDGGRFLLATLSLKLDRSVAVKIVKVLGVVFGLILLGLFVYSITIKINYTILFFAFFIFLGVTFNKGGEYVKIYQNLSFKPVSTPILVKEIAVQGNSQIKTLYPILNGEFYYKVAVVNGDKIAIICGEELYAMLSVSSPYETINCAIKKVHENS